MRNSGLRRSLYEYLFYRAIEQAKVDTSGPLMVSQARRMRAEVEDRLAAQGMSIDDPRLRVSPVLEAIEDTMVAHVPGYSGLYGDRTMASAGYQRVSADFMDMVGLPHQGADGATLPANPGPLGARLPISPYDSRYASRSTVKQAGSALLYVPEDMIEMVADGDPARVPATRLAALKLYSGDPENGRSTEAGPAYTLDDAAGLSELMGRMSQREYAQVRSWVLAGARTSTGQIDPDRFMSPAALERSVAILDELAAQGTSYTISKDRYPGQIRARINGTRLSVRLTDTRENENFVGRVYDSSGVQVYLSTNYRGPGQFKAQQYVPTAADCVSVLRVAQGKPVARLDGQGMVGAVNTHVETVRDRRNGTEVAREFNDSYFSDASSSMVLGDLPGIPAAENAKIVVRRDGKRRGAASRFFADAEAGQTFLDEAVTSARTNLSAALDVERLVAEAEAHAPEIVEGTYVPEFSGDATVAAVQRSYWDVLTGAQQDLLMPGAVAQDYYERIGVIGEMQLAGADEVGLHDMMLDGITYAGTPADQVRAHAEDLLDSMVGTTEPREELDPASGEVVAKTFDPIGVASFMSSEHGQWRNNDDLVAAMRAAGTDPGTLRGNNFFHGVIKNRLITFDESTAKSFDEVEDPFLVRMGEVVRDSIERNGCEVAELLIDDAGVVNYRALRQSGQAAGRQADEVTGQIGQIFAPGEYGAVTTRFAGSENYMFVPGYSASIVSQRPGESLSVEERTRLRGYEQVMTDHIQSTIASDLLTTRTEVGEPTNVNSVYLGLYDVRHEVDFIDKSREEGLDDAWREAILGTEGRRVRYGNDIKDGSTINAEYQARMGRGRRDASDDNFFDAWVLTGGRNMSIMTSEGDGFFDPMMTSGSTNQGITRYLVESAVVNADGSITRGETDDRTPLMKHPDARFMSFNPYDRQQMTASNLMQAAAVTEPVGTSMATFGGWNFDDGIVVSTDFARSHRIRGTDGSMRDLVVGDKLSDLHGNKGVISLVVDPQMDPAAAREAGLEDAVRTFADNPDLQVVMSPFSAVSRFNGGSARELMEQTSPVVFGSGEQADVVPGGMGRTRFIVTHMAVDAKTRVYGDDDVAAGRGRKVSSQLAWALGAQGCEKVMAECYGTNSSGLANLREMARTMGLDVEADGTLRVGPAEQSEADTQRLFEMPELVLNSKGRLDAEAMKRDFGNLIGTSGGTLELPFELRLPTGEPIEHVTDSSYGLPVMSSHLRSGQDLADGSVTMHDYTNHYLSIYDQANRFRFAQQALASGGLDAAARERHAKTVAEAPMRAQMAFDSITDDLKDRRFSGKHNVFKESIMAARAPHSATAVWSADPRLDIDQLAMGPAMAASMDVAADDHVLVWRDPMLRDGGVRYMRVAIDERLTGVAINPVMDKSFDGDFDGDAVAVVKLNGKAAQADAMERLSVAANLLDMGSKREDGTYELAMQNALDVKVSQHADPSLAERFEDLRLAANELHADLSAGEIDRAAHNEAAGVLVEELSEYYHDALSTQYGGATLRFDGVENHLASVMRSCVETGAKGKPSKVVDYAHYLGADVELVEDQDGRPGLVVKSDLGQTKATRADHEAVQYATAVKAFGTGVAGTYSQRGVKALRNTDLKAVLELTYPVTQSVLQSKHDPEEAKHKYEMLMGPARDLWKGRRMVEVRGADGNKTWEAARDERGDEIQADTETWKRQFVEIYSSPEGLNVPVNEDYVAAIATSLSNSDDLMNDIEAEPTPSNPSTASTMDKLAYGGTFEDLVEAARRRENLFEGVQNANFAPFAVRDNARALAEHDAALEAGDHLVPEPEITPIVRKDVTADGQARGHAKRSPWAPAVGGRRRSPVADYEFATTAASADDGMSL